MPVKKPRRKRSAMARMRPFWMPIGFCTALVAAGLVTAATWSGFNPKRVAVSGNDRVSSGEILARAQIAPHISIWLQNTGAIRRRIEAIPYIATVRITRAPPDAIRIAVTERMPFALVRSGYDEAVVDRALRVLEDAAGAAPGPVFVLKPGIALTPGSYVVTGDALEMRQAYEEMSAIQIVPVEFDRDRYGGLIVTLHGGLRLLLGASTDLKQKLTLAQAILTQAVGSRRSVAAIDLRAPSAPVLVYR
jgi:cell division septal protein FtsQ